MDKFDNFLIAMEKIDESNHEQFLQLVNQTNCPYLHEKLNRDSKVYPNSINQEKKDS
ncbi:MAG: hypothetical protein ACOCXH_06415 [Cyclobacteriaceae bacterium]